MMSSNRINSSESTEKCRLSSDKWDSYFYRNINFLIANIGLLRTARAPGLPVLPYRGEEIITTHLWQSGTPLAQGGKYTGNGKTGSTLLENHKYKLVLMLVLMLVL